MALPSSGEISLAHVSTELGQSSTSTRSLDDAIVRSLLGVASGSISLLQGYGRSSAFAATISSHQQQLNLASWASANGWNGSSPATITIGSGVYIWSDNTSIAGLTTGVFPGGLTIINNGYIIGKGGNGGSGSSTGLAGGPALLLNCNVTIANNSFIAGGGGGGGSVSNTSTAWNTGGGGGAGGGAGGNGGAGAGGVGGSIGMSGGMSSVDQYSAGGSGGGGGGRVLPGTGGASRRVVKPTGFSGTLGFAGSGGGAGGGGAGACGGPNFAAVTLQTSAGGSGDSVGGSAGPGAGTFFCGGGGGGGWGALGATSLKSTQTTLTIWPGGIGGRAVTLNGFSVTWTATGSRYGAIS